MTQVVTPSEDITVGQIGKFQELLGAALRKSGLPSTVVQQVLETTGGELVAGLVTALRTAVETISEMFSRRVTVNLSRSPQEVLDATGRTQYTDANVVASMPHGEGAEVEVFFFKLGRYASDDQLEKEFDRRGFKPADPYSLAAVNETDPAFADTHPNGTHWKNDKGQWCFAAFRRFRDGRDVSVDRLGVDWGDRWWFAGVRK